MFCVQKLSGHFLFGSCVDGTGGTACAALRSQSGQPVQFILLTKLTNPGLPSPLSFALMSNFAARRPTSVHGSATTLACNVVKISLVVSCSLWTESQASRLLYSQTHEPAQHPLLLFLFNTVAFSLQHCRKVTSREHTVATTFNCYTHGTTERDESEEDKVGKRARLFCYQALPQATTQPFHLQNFFKNGVTASLSATCENI